MSKFASLGGLNYPDKIVNVERKWMDITRVNFFGIFRKIVANFKLESSAN